MNLQTQQNTSGFNINSKYYINNLESTIIQIAKALSIENKIPVDPDSKEIARQIVQKKINTLLSEEAKDIIAELNNLIDKTIKETTDGDELRHIASSFKSVLKLMGLDNV